MEEWLPRFKRRIKGKGMLRRLHTIMWHYGFPAEVTEKSLRELFHLEDTAFKNQINRYRFYAEQAGMPREEESEQQ